MFAATLRVYRRAVSRSHARRGSTSSESPVRIVVVAETIDVRASVFLALADEPRIELLASGTTAGELASFCRAFEPEVVVVQQGLSQWSREELLDVSHLPRDKVLVIPSADSQSPPPADNVVDDPRDLVSHILSVARGGPHPDS